MKIRGKHLGMVLALLAVCGCEPALLIEGRVADTRGQALPGVAVTLEGTSIQAQTNGLGVYRMSCPNSYLGAQRDVLALGFIKSGYGSARVSLPVPGGPSVTAPPAVLWPLPPDEGVFLLSEHRYLRMTPANAPRYLSAERGLCFGTKKLAQLKTFDADPHIFSYRMHGYDLQLARLEQVRAVEFPEGEASPERDNIEYNETIWVAAEPVPVTASPVDEPERVLYQVRSGVPLAPGHYAVHWGALDGFFSTDRRLFLFEVAGEPDAAGQAAPVAEEQNQTNDTPPPRR